MVAKRVERAVFWIGSLSGIVISLTTIYEKTIAPSPAKLAVTFFESTSTKLSLVAPSTKESDLTEEVPLQLQVKNLGGKASANTKLYLTHNPSLTMTAQYQKEAKPTWNAPNEPMRQLSLPLENINPGESYLIPVKLRFRIPREFNYAFHTPREETDQSLVFKIYSDISSDTVPNTREELTVELGRCDKLIERSPAVFWVGHGEGDQVSVLKVKEDYPCR
jgi:hypothetical protein